MADEYNYPGRFTCGRPGVVQVVHSPAKVVQQGGGAVFVDFGLARFGTVRFGASAAADGSTADVQLGEKLSGPNEIDRNPPGSIRYRHIAVPLKRGTHEYQVRIPGDSRNTGRAAILMPPDIGEVMPFRFCRISGDDSVVDVQSVRQIAAQIPFNDAASHFECSDEVLNAVWRMCRHTIRATTFCGVYVDGDRERIPYEGDAYINQLSHYCCDFAPQAARYSHEYLMQYPTWFTDWMMLSVFMAWADYMYTGRTESLECFYEDLKAKTLIDLARGDGLITTHCRPLPAGLEKRLHLYHDRYPEKECLIDLVDWPPGSFMNGEVGERDDHEMLPINTAVNALHFQAVRLMSRIAAAMGKQDDAEIFRRQAARVYSAINAGLFDPARGAYVDGEGSHHSSLHANAFPLAFGIVPPDRMAGVSAWIRSRGMACSVYGAQHLLEGLYRAGESQYALDLMSSRGPRSWWNMLAEGSTMALEAWGLHYKSNLDWNHAWGTAPANIIPRKLMGVETLEPGFAKISLCPQPASLTAASLKLPTPRGPITAHFQAAGHRRAVFEAAVPKDIQVVVPPAVKDMYKMVINGETQ